jgi:hypothetical protein
VGERKCWGSTACMAATGGVRAEEGVAWRVWEKAAGEIKAAACRGATRGLCGEQEVALVRLQQRRAAVKSGSGRWRQRGKAGRGQRGSEKRRRWG